GRAAPSASRAPGPLYRTWRRPQESWLRTEASFLAPGDFFHLSPQFLGRDDAALDQRLRECADPLLVIRELVVRLRRQCLDVLAMLVDRDAPLAEDAEENDR